LQEIPLRKLRQIKLLPYIATGVILIAIVWAMTYRSILIEREQAFANSTEQAERLAGFFEQNVLQIFRYSDTYLKLVRREYLKHGSIDTIR
jgi:uncharacterized membrane protein (Fun14 family)